LPSFDVPADVPERLRIGSKIEANYQSRGTFLRGRISYFDERDECYDVWYDNNCYERGVENIRLLAPTVAAVVDDNDSGSDIEDDGKDDGGGAGDGGKDDDVGGADDGGKENDGGGDVNDGRDDNGGEAAVAVTTSVKEEARLFTRGTIVDALYSNGQWYGAMVTAVHADGTYKLKYHDGGDADKVKPANLKHAGYAVPFPLPIIDRPIDGAEKLPIGCNVEANYESRGSFFRGRIAYFNESDGCYDVWFDDDCYERNVEEIRLLE